MRYILCALLLFNSGVVGAVETHHIILRVVRVTTDWVSFDDTSGWTAAAPVKESRFLRYYEVAIWEETASVHLYKLPNEYDPLYSYRPNVTSQQAIDYRENFVERKYAEMPEEYSAQRSRFLKAAFIDIIDYLVEQHPNSYHHLMFNGHGGPGGQLFEALLFRPEAQEFLSAWRKKLGSPLGVIDMGGPCTKGSFADLETFCGAVRYYIASDMPNGGYLMDQWTPEKWDEVRIESQYHRLFSIITTLKEALKGRIDIRRKRYEYARNDMVANQVTQANYLYDCESFRQFSTDFKDFLYLVGVEYDIYDDLYQYMITNKAPSELVEQFNKVIVHRADNRDFFEWREERNGMLMPSRGLLEPNPDFDDDGIVGFTDFLIFAAQFGKTRGDERYNGRMDLDLDGVIGFSDFLIFAGRFGE